MNLTELRPRNDAEEMDAARAVHPHAYSPPGWYRMPGEHYDPRIVGIVRRVEKTLEQGEGRA